MKIDFPGAAWEHTTTDELGWDPALLEEAVEVVRADRTSALLIATNGRIVLERYFDVAPKEADAPFASMRFDTLGSGEVVEDVASLQKSVIAILALMAMESGLLRLDAPMSDYLGAGWSQASREQESAITVKHVMSMTSGLTIQSEYAAPAGTVWAYNTNVCSRMLGVLESCTGNDIVTLTRNWLTDPLGRWLLADITPLSVASQSLNPRYALLWWLNELGPPDTDQADRLLIPSAPRGLLAARGALVRLLYVAPKALRSASENSSGAPSDEGEIGSAQKMGPGHISTRKCALAPFSLARDCGYRTTYPRPLRQALNARR